MNDSPSTNGANGRGAGGRFAPGNKGGPGNPHARRVARLRSTLYKSVKAADLREVIAALLAQAKAGDVPSIKELLQRLLGPPVELDVRITLKGGEFTAETVGGSGRGEVDARRRNWDEVEADWAGSIKWTRTIKKDSLPKDFLTIGISSWDTGPGARFRLTPIRRGSGEVIELKIANLCEENPLEWWEFEPTFDKDDVDFKWLYRLFEAKDGGSLLKAIRGSDPRSKFPYPKLTRRGARTTGNTGCTGGQFTPPR